MNDLNSLVSALELTGGERILLRSDQIPQLIVGDTRHDLATAAASTTTALERLADQVLSPAGKKALAEQRVAVEPLPASESVVPVRVMVQRIGPLMSVELQRDTSPSDTSETLASPPSPSVTVPPPGRELPAPPLEPPARRRSGTTAGVAVAREAEPLQQQETSVAVIDGLKRAASTAAIDAVIHRALQRNASAIYLRGGHAPLARVGTRMEQLAVDAVDGDVIEAAAAALAPGPHDGAISDAVWVRHHEGIRQRWHAFTDARGPGLVIDLRWRSPEAILQGDLHRHIKRICEEDDGIVVVAGPATANVRQIVAAVGSWTANRRAGYIISIEPPNGLDHEITGAFVSARRIGSLENGHSAAIRRAAHEAPDVLIVALSSGSNGEEAIRAARPGCLVIVGVVAPTAARAVESLLTHVAPQHESELRQSLAARFRCGLSYRSLHAAGGGRKIVHDFLIATPEVRARLERWDISALEKLQRSGADGMRSLDTALAEAAVRGEISIGQAASHALDGREVVNMIRRAARERRRARSSLPRRAPRP